MLNVIILPFDPDFQLTGSYDYRALPLPGSVVHIDTQRIASWSYNKHTRELVTYDDEEIGVMKGRWIKGEGLA